MTLRRSWLPLNQWHRKTGTDEWPDEFKSHFPLSLPPSIISLLKMTHIPKRIYYGGHFFSVECRPSSVEQNLKIQNKFLSLPCWARWRISDAGGREEANRLPLNCHKKNFTFHKLLRFLKFSFLLLGFIGSVYVYTSLLVNGRFSRLDDDSPSDCVRSLRAVRQSEKKKAFFFYLFTSRIVGRDERWGKT